MKPEAQQIIRGVIHWDSGFSVDADGAPTCYAPAGSGLLALDYLANAGRTGDWWGIVIDSNGDPVIQGPHDPAPGYYVSATALFDPSRGLSDPHRYVNSEEVPYVVMPPELRAHGVYLGDVAWVTRAEHSCGAVVADVGPRGQLGEGSIALARALRIPASPKHGGVTHGVEWLIFPGSRRGWPRTPADVELQAATLYDEWKRGA